MVSQHSLSEQDDSGDTTAMRNAGFSDRQAAFATTLLFHAEIAAAGEQDPPDGIGEWVATRLPPEWICRLLANHVTSADEGIAIFERAVLPDGAGIRRRLDMRADALGANCRDLIVDPAALRHRLNRGDSN